MSGSTPAIGDDAVTSLKPRVLFLCSCSASSSQMEERILLWVREPDNDGS